MSLALRPRMLFGLLAFEASLALSQSPSYPLSPSLSSLPAGSYGASMTATLQNAPQTLDFSVCFYTGYGSSMPIVPDSYTYSDGSAVVAFGVPASTIQDVPPAAFTAGSFPASLYTVPASTQSCLGSAQAQGSAGTVNLQFPTLTSLSLTSTPRMNIRFSTLVPSNLTLSGTNFIGQPGTTTSAASSVNFTSATAIAGQVRYISPTSLVSTIPTTIPDGTPSVDVQVCNTAVYSYCSESKTLTLKVLANSVYTFTATPSTASPSQPVTLSITFGTPKPTTAGSMGGLATFSYENTVFPGIPLKLDPTASFVPAAATNLYTTSPLTSPIQADLNQDGITDLLMIQTGTAILHRFFGATPLGNFAADAPITIAICGVILDAAVADLNHDGLPDITLLCKTSSSTANSIYTLLNDGSGNFLAPANSYSSAVYGSHILAADYNKDGKEDLLVAGLLDAAASETGLQVLLGDGTGNFSLGPVTSGLSGAPSTSFGGYQIVAADFNNDGAPDIAILNGANATGTVDQSINVFQNDGTGAFSKAVNLPTDGTNTASFVIAPLSPGLPPDLFIGSSGNGFSIASNQSFGDIAFSSAVQTTNVPGLKRFVTGDFNDDGIRDVAVDDGTTVHVLTGDGNGNFSAFYPALSIPSYSSATVVSAIDENADNFSDLLILSRYGNAKSIGYGLRNYITSGTTSATMAPTTFPVGVHTLSARNLGSYTIECGSTLTTLTIIIPAAPITWTPNPATITYGTPLSTGQLDATSTAAGTFTYTPALGTILSAGRHTLSVSFTPNDPTSFTSTTATTTITVSPATPVLSWLAPASIVVGTALSSTQLDATAAGVDGLPLAGTFTYTPASGTILAAGTQTLSVLFTPSDLADYTTATTSVSLNVLSLGLSGLSATSATLGSSATTITLTGTGFDKTATVKINGTSIPTTFVNITTLTAVIPASDFLTVQTLPIAVLETSLNQTSASLPFQVIAPAAAVIFSGPSTIAPGSQITLNFALTNTYPVDLTATFTINFVPAMGLPDDPNVQFSTGGRTWTVTIPANSLTLPPVEIQSGTVAGSLTVGTSLEAGGANVTPASIKPLSIQASFAAPGITSVKMTPTDKTLTVTIRGFSNTREISGVTFHFTPTPGHSIQTQDVKLDVDSIYATWYASPDSSQYGSECTYTQVFNLNSDATVVGKVTVTLTNSQGTSPEANTP